MLIEINNKKILFIHITKTGGTSIENFFCDLLKIDNFKWPNFYPKYLWGRLFSNNNSLCYQHFTMKEIFDEYKLLKIKDIDFIFTVIRDPLERYKSELNAKYSAGDIYGKNLKDFSKNHELLSHARDQYSYFKDYEDKINIYRFEQGLQNIVNDVCKKNNIDTYLKIEHRNKAQLKKKISKKQIIYAKKFYKIDYLHLPY
tara:strand:+ start:4292 stop:4891 length:600 start_codon:yes stop_codon:yes gene_type:complete